MWDEVERCKGAYLNIRATEDVNLDYLRSSLKGHRQQIAAQCNKWLHLNGPVEQQIDWTWHGAHFVQSSKVMRHGVLSGAAAD